MQNNKVVKKTKNLSTPAMVSIIAVIVCVLVLGTSLAWFTHKSSLEGEGTTPIATTNFYVDDSTTPLTESTLDIQIAGVGDVNKSVKFNCTGATIDMLAVATITLSLFDQNDVLLPDATTATYVTLTYGNNWISSTDGKLYYSYIIDSDDTSTKIDIFNKITISSSAIEGYTLKISLNLDVIQANDVGVEQLETSGYAVPDAIKNLV